MGVRADYHSRRRAMDVPHMLGAVAWYPTLDLYVRFGGPADN